MQQKTKVIIGCMIGNIVEWYEFTIYGYLGILLGKLFFPAQDPLSSIIASFSVFAVGFIARPVGGIILGLIGDRNSRRYSLLLSLYMITISTFTMGCLPTFNQIGILAPICLTLLRIIQGIALGGEHSGAMIMITEQAPLYKKGKYGSLAALSLVLGTMLGSLVVLLLEALLTPTELMAWGWRVPFMLAGVFLLFGVKFRSTINDSEEFLKSKKEPFNKRIITPNFILSVMSGILLNSLLGFGYYTVTIFFFNYLKARDIYDGAVKVSFIIASFTVLMLSIILVGNVADRYVKFHPIRVIPYLLLIFCPFLYFLVGSQEVTHLFIAYCLLVCLVGGYFGVMPSFLSSLFPVHVRYIGVAIVNNFGMALFGGSAPLVLVLLSNKFSLSLALSCTFVIVGLMSILGSYVYSFVQSSNAVNNK